MKKYIALSFILITTFFLFAGCSSVNSSFTKLAPKDTPADALFLVVNKSAKDAKVKPTEDIKLDDTNEQLLIIPKYNNLSIEICKINEILETTEVSYQKRRVGNNFVLNINTIRPEGAPHYKIVAKSPEGYAEYYIYYDGRENAPEVDWISLIKKGKEDEFNFNEISYMFTYTKNDIKKLFGKPKTEEEITLFDSQKATKLTYKDATFETISADAEGSLLYSAELSNDKIAHVRGVKIGDSLKSVIEKFPDSNDDTRYSLDTEGREYRVLYGEYVQMFNFGIIEYNKYKEVVAVTYSQAGGAVTFVMENEKVKSVKYLIPLT